MGAEQPKPKKKMGKIELEIVCDKVYQYLMIHRGRKIDELALKEREVKEKLKNSKRLYGDCLFDIASIVTLLNWIMASKIIMRNVQFLKERSMQIVSAANERNSEKIAPMIKYIQSVIWASERLNLKQIKEFTYMIQAFFGKEFIRLALQGDSIDKELTDCFRFVEPTKKQVADYLRNMVKRYNFNQINLDKELPSSYQEPKQPPKQPPSQPNPGHYPPPPGHGDHRFNYNNPNNTGGGGYFDNPNNMPGRSNWGHYMNQNNPQNNNLNFNPNDFGKLAPSRIDDPAFNNPPNLGPQPNKQSTPENDFDKMINDLEGGSLVRDGNELVNPSMSQMKLGSKTKPNPPPKDDFDDLINSLQGNVVADLQKQDVKPPAMRGPPKRRNKATKPISNEPEAYQYTDEVDQDTEEKHYDDLSLEYRLEQMRKLKV